MGFVAESMDLIDFLSEYLEAIQVWTPILGQKPGFSKKPGFFNLF
jgi:hypothetical protein